jgi:hypothetical protein
MQKYLRLVDYDNACKIIDFINNDGDDYAKFIVGGVSLNVSEKNWNKVEEYIKSLGIRYAIEVDRPEIVKERILEYYGIKRDPII